MPPRLMRAPHTYATVRRVAGQLLILATAFETATCHAVGTKIGTPIVLDGRIEVRAEGPGLLDRESWFVASGGLTRGGALDTSARLLGPNRLEISLRPVGGFSPTKLTITIERHEDGSLGAHALHWTYWDGADETSEDTHLTGRIDLSWGDWVAGNPIECEFDLIDDSLASLRGDIVVRPEPLQQ